MNIMDIEGVSEVSVALENLWIGVIEFLPQLLIAIIIFIVGWLVGLALERGVRHLIDALKVDTLLRNAGFESLLAKGGFQLHSGAFIGVLVKWFIILVFLIAAFEVVGLSDVNIFLREVLAYLPNVIVAALVLLAGSIVANIVGRLVEGSIKAAEVPTAKLLGSVARWAILVFAIIVALSQLGIAAQFLQTLFTGFIAMLALAGGLAFGLGGRDHASRVLDSVSKQIRD